MVGQLSDTKSASPLSVATTKAQTGKTLIPKFQEGVAGFQFFSNFGLNQNSGTKAHMHLHVHKHMACTLTIRARGVGACAFARPAGNRQRGCFGHKYEATFGTATRFL